MTNTEWTRAPEHERCSATVNWVPARCDLTNGHAGDHKYMSIAGTVVSFHDAGETGVTSFPSDQRGGAQ